MLQLNAEIATSRSSRIDSIASGNRHVTEGLHLPLSMEAGETDMAGKELLHGGLFEVAFLGDESVQGCEKGVDV